MYHKNPQKITFAHKWQKWHPSLRVCLIAQLSGVNENFQHLFIFSAFDNVPLNWKSRYKITENVKWKFSTENIHWMQSISLLETLCCKFNYLKLSVLKTQYLGCVW